MHARDVLAAHYSGMVGIVALRGADIAVDSDSSRENAGQLSCDCRLGKFDEVGRCDGRRDRKFRRRE